MFEDAHDQFAAVVERDAQLVVAAVQPLSVLVGMPVFVGDPLGSGFGKFQYGDMLCGTAKDAVDTLFKVNLISLIFNYPTAAGIA